MTKPPFLLVSGDFVLTGGMDMANYYLADYVARQGNPVHVVSHRVDSTLLKYPHLTWHRVQRPGSMHSLGEYFLRAQGFKVAAELEPDSPRIIVNGGNCPLPGINWVHYVHAATTAHGGTNLLRRWKNQLVHSFSKASEKRAFEQAQAIVANSNRTKADLVRAYSIPPAQIHTIFFGTNPGLYHPVDEQKKRELRSALRLSPKSFIACFIGGLGDRRKGFDTLFSAWAGMSAQPDIELAVVGHGAELPLWKERAARLPGGNRICFLGFRNDVPDILKACDASIAPTRYEAFGLTVQEALLSGLPTIVSAGAGAAELISGELKPLLLGNPEDVGELTKKIEYLYANRDALRKETLLLSQKLSQRTWDMMSREIYDLANHVKIKRDIF